MSKQTVAKYDDIPNLTPITLNVGDYIWTGTSKTDDWDVPKYVRTNDKVVKVTKNGTTNEVEIQLNNLKL